MNDKPKVVCDLDKVTHVIIMGKEYEVFKLTSSTGTPEGKALLLGVPCSAHEQRPTAKQLQKDPNRKPFKYWAKQGSGFGGVQFGDNALRLDFYPKSQVSSSNASTTIAG